MTARDLLEQNLPLIERVIASVCRQRGVYDHDAEDIRQEVLLKLAENDRAALASFRGDCSLGTFIKVVTTRISIDEIRRQKGRWRSSRIARRLEPAAESLERLVYRDGLAYEEAVAKLVAEGAVQSRAELEEIWPKLPQRPARTFVDPENVPEPTSDDDPGRQIEDLEQQKHQSRLEAALKQILATFPAEDRLIIERHFIDGRSVADLARELGLEQRPLYRRRDKLLKALRKALEARGLRWDDDDDDEESRDARPSI